MPISTAMLRAGVRSITVLACSLTGIAVVAAFLRSENADASGAALGVTPREYRDRFAGPVL